jgi:BirA family transcriptional regulator, biotin operon repressor / biotin---[acetyl-CoA-carboxylase] ligase
MDDPLEPQAILAALATPAARAFWQIEVLPEIDSTNAECQRRAAAGAAAGLALFAESQSAGRGRRGNRWESHPGESLVLSLLLRPPAPPHSWPRLGLVLAVAAAEALESLVPVRITIKWPNDLLINGHKVAGILLESRLPAGHGEGGFLIAGIGINVGQRAFPAGLRSPATSLRLAAREPPPRARLAAALLEAFHQRYTAPGHDWHATRLDFSSRDALAGRIVRAESPAGRHQGRCLGLAEDGTLLLAAAPGQPPIRLADAHDLTPLD